MNLWSGESDDCGETDMDTMALWMFFSSNEGPCGKLSTAVHE